MVNTVIAPFLEMQQENPMAWIVWTELATPNVYIYSGQSIELWLEIDGLFHHDGKPYIP